MATYRKRGTNWQVQVRRAGHQTVSRTFRLKSDGQAWARQLEGEIDRSELPVDRRGLRTTTLGCILSRYQTEITATKRGRSQEDYRLRYLLGLPLAAVPLSKLSPALFAQYRDQRLDEVQGVTVRRELAIIRHALEVARKEWDVALSANPVALIKLPRLPPARTRRLAPGELDALLQGCGPRLALLRVVIEFAVETALRRGELVSVRWQDVDLNRRTLHVPVTKNGHARTIPLTRRAVELLRGRSREGELVFPTSGNAVRLSWERLVRRLGLPDLHFHDLRHEGISRFFERGLSVPEVALISGHRDYRQLARYTHLRAEDVAMKLNGAV